jgi:two-component system CheB/CheR fusion protein
MPERFHRAYKEGLSRYLTTGEGRMIGQTAEFMARTKGGDEFPVELSLSAAPTDAGPMFTVIIRDVRERKKLERAVLEVTGLEQRRIGQDLHDGIGQELTGVGMMVQNLVESLGKDTPEAEQAKKIGAGIRRAMSQARALSRGLMPVESDATGLMTALTDLAARINEQGVVQCVFHCPKPVLLTDTTAATHLFRIAQEAVTNALKHGKAKNVEVDLREHGSHILLQVRDDGKGIDSPDAHSPGLGMKTMRYRAGMINAVLHVESGDGNGTVITCSVAREAGGGGRN